MDIDSNGIGNPFILAWADDTNAVVNYTTALSTSTAGATVIKTTSTLSASSSAALTATGRSSAGRQQVSGLLTWMAVMLSWLYLI